MMILRRLVARGTFFRRTLRLNVTQILRFYQEYAIILGEESLEEVYFDYFTFTACLYSVVWFVCKLAQEIVQQQLKYNLQIEKQLSIVTDSRNKFQQK